MSCIIDAMEKAEVLHQLLSKGSTILDGDKKVPVIMTEQHLDLRYPRYLYQVVDDGFDIQFTLPIADYESRKQLQRLFKVYPEYQEALKLLDPANSHWETYTRKDQYIARLSRQAIVICILLFSENCNVELAEWKKQLNYRFKE